MKLRLHFSIQAILDHNNRNAGRYGSLLNVGGGTQSTRPTLRSIVGIAGHAKQRRDQKPVLAIPILLSLIIAGHSHSI